MCVCSKSISADIKTDKVPIDQHSLAGAGLHLASGLVIIIIMSQQAGRKTLSEAAVPTSLETR